LYPHVELGDNYPHCHSLLTFPFVRFDSLGLLYTHVISAVSLPSTAAAPSSLPCCSSSRAPAPAPWMARSPKTMVIFQTSSCLGSTCSPTLDVLHRRLELGSLILLQSWPWRPPASAPFGAPPDSGPIRRAPRSGVLRRTLTFAPTAHPCRRRPTARPRRRGHMARPQAHAVVGKPLLARAPESRALLQAGKVPQWPLEGSGQHQQRRRTSMY
jgi:hypothetical protein